MDLTKFHQLLNEYQRRLDELPETTPNHRKRRQALGMLPTFRHLLGYLGPEGRLNDDQKLIVLLKLNRWLGFIQAVLWDLNLGTISEFRRHLREVFK